MAGKAKKTAVSKAQPKPTSEQIARITLRPSANAAAIIKQYGTPFGEQDVVELMKAIAESIEELQSGDMKRCEAMLMAQASALQSVFMNFARRAQNQEYMSNMEAFFRMAMKAQNQCRMTIETLATIKNPPIVYAKQANIANGPQQVNNGIPNASRAREEKTIQSNGLLTEGVEHGPTLDTRGTAAAGGVDPAMATLE